MNDTVRPSDADAVRAELRHLGKQTGFPVMFGGTIERGRLTLSGFIGTRSTILRNLVIDAQRGVGGRAIAEQHPVGVQDYSNSNLITHEYDFHIDTEGIESLLAVPVVVRGCTRGLLYGGLRANRPLADRATDLVVHGARKLAHEIEVRDEVDRRLAMLRADGAAHGPARDARFSDAIIESYLALRGIAERLDDDALGDEVQAVERRLRNLTLPNSGERITRLSRRELDVLAYVALGCRNAEIADQLSLTVQTVKSYMRNLMSKLEVRSRQEAVVEARRRGLLP
ncbi:helix-turn-helix transcriptional regulator [Rhodococcoides yunnanense]|uniref:LuxR C-terminal-related transcriptional regulator n=1 Tax=Rhodococcoides yunnanense TaxID=278209 RepID=A0ABU4BKR2_9NOCA|nr:LuxR C-terminal-related transcriptional regulator [Rhodococcus yunnanensis]MDV6264656.1 LuxR C-terminal-related transcriptional regulator [Rhodococcus yunnanensis]